MGKKSIHLIGLLYLLVIICAGFSQGYVRATIIEPDDATTTASNILSNNFLFRIGLVSDMIAFVLDAIISVLLYQLFSPVHKGMALVSSALRLVAHPAIGSINLLNHYSAIHVLQEPGIMASFNTDQIESMSLLFLDAHQYGYLIAGSFFGIHCLFLGILLYKSGLTPRLISYLIIASAMGYILETFGNFLFPGNEVSLAWVVGLSAALGEGGLAIYLLVTGGRRTFIARQTKQMS